MTDAERRGVEQRVLVLAPTSKDAALTQSVLHRAGVECVTCANLEQVCALLNAGAGVVLMAEESVATDGGNCLTEWLGRQAPWSDLPILLLARPGADSAAVAQAMDQLGNITVLERPTRVAALVSAVRAALRARHRQYQVRDHLAERERSEWALRVSEERFRMIADNMAQLAWTCDTLGNVTWYNQRWLDYTGLSFDEMKGWDWRKVQHPDHLARVVARVNQSAETGEPWEDTFPLRGKDGEYHWFLSRAVPIRNEAGEIVCWFGTNTDVTERIRMEEALRDADRRKDEFLAVLAHELRNPLAPIRNSLHILRMTAEQDPAAERVSEMLERQVNHMVRLVDDLMEVSRITRGKIELRKESIEVAAIIRTAVETSRPLIDAAGHNLALALPPEPLVLEGDPMRLAQVVANLLNNAAKYTEAGGQIWLTVRREAGAVAISVRDTGAGIPPDMLPRVFDLFTQVDRHANRAQGGLGIGLALVKSLVEMHGGSVKAHSEGTGQGCEFVVCLPLSTARLPTDPLGTESVVADKPAARRILVVDDNRDAANSLGMLLKCIGADVRIAYNGPDALEAVATWKPAVVLLDIGMPGMDGYEVAQRIREEPQSEGMTLIALTGWGQEDDRRRARSAGFDHHMIKPPELNTLKTLLLSLSPRRES
jgi:PAS domain S-box-containing protein